MRLGHPGPLRRCLRGATQNANESLHSKIRAKCHKTGFVGLERLTAAKCVAIAEFNSGIELYLGRLCEAVGIVSGSQLLASAKKADMQRLRQSLRQAQAITKEARRARKAAHVSDSGSYAKGGF